MKPIAVSINPTYLCNFRCDFCYLTEEQLADKAKVNLVDLDARLWEITQHTKIQHIDLYGGEVTLLPQAYVDDMFSIIQQHYFGPINVVTNLSRTADKAPWILRDEVILSVSWDYKCREKWDGVLQHIAELPKDVHILMLAGKCMIDWDDEQIGAAQWILNSLQNVQSVEIKPYSSNQANQEQVSFRDFEIFIQRWFEMEQHLPEPRRYEFVNEQLIQDSIAKTRNAWSDDHVYITPSGKFGVLEFDVNDNEYFLEYDTFNDYVAWTELEKNRVQANEICQSCPYFGHCLSEHLRDVKTLNNSCNGFRFLLDWYNERS